MVVTNGVILVTLQGIYFEKKKIKEPFHQKNLSC